ncbi:hypothetical protein JOD02_000800 [Caldicoprobacter guelmensis]|uniref:hypothetical protein n=1 Tax=Caldicoprobacter guelmensis TaxID=1170224 RepID=UPI00195E9423|nr:hypothetical protein [Caldicoprobacter guelmensis]MBM7581963.1 hypothetical protein [Caldicoprobacter guelmensis]
MLPVNFRYSKKKKLNWRRKPGWEKIAQCLPSGANMKKVNALLELKFTEYLKSQLQGEKEV